MSRPTNLLCEYAVNPIGIDVILPRFSWVVNHKGRGQYQTAYQVLVASSLKNIKNNYGGLWNSGKVKKNESVNIVYFGKKLKNGQVCFWKVRTWDKDGKVSPYSDIATFEIGLLESQDWKGTWIGNFGYGNDGSALLFRKGFNFKRKVSRARVYISGLGYYELRMNGQKVGDHVLDPGWTNYSKRILYATYDVTKYLRKGKNVIGVIVGNGWHSAPKMILQMNIDFSNGTKESISTGGESDRWQLARSPIIRNSIYEGETYDARLEKPGWDTIDYDFEKEVNKQKIGKWTWDRTLPVEGPGGKMMSQLINPIKIIKSIKPVKISNPKPGIYVYDIGQNIAGWVKLKVKGPRGTKVVLKFAETLYKNGTINQENLRGATSKDIYILKGKGLEVWEPRFTYHGFRYVQVEGFPGKPNLDSITAKVVHSSIESRAKFECSNALLNQIQKNILWTELNNLHSIPTDCPQRAERFGWLNDMTTRCEQAIYNFDMSRFYTKWMNDIRDTQDKYGAITDTAPYRGGLRPACPVSSCYLLIPWFLYLHYGDRRILEKHYDGFKRWEEFLGTHTKNYIVTYSNWGDWAPPIKECEGNSPRSAHTPGELMSTGYYYYNALILSKVARILKKYKDEKYYLQLAERIKTAYNDKFLNKNTNQYAKGSQASNAFSLFLGLVPESRIEHVLENLVKDIIKNHSGHLSTGNQCTKYVMEVLTDLGKVDIAYKIATQTTYPSWGYMISKGATTIWERWEYETGKEMNSHNHPMMGSVCSWFYKALAGIKVDIDGVGFSRFIIKPCVPDNLKFVKASLKTIRGLISSRWIRKANTFTLNVIIPGNSKAKIYIPKFGHKTNNIIIKESEKIIWKNNKFIKRVKGIDKGKENTNHVIFDVGSGTYSFKSIY